MSLCSKSVVTLVLSGLIGTSSAFGFEPPKPEKSDRAETPEAAPDTTQKPVPLNTKRTVFLDRTGKRVLLKTHVVLREGLLEMFCCLKQTKEHESILSIDAEAYVIHGALLALGAKPGRTATYTDAGEYVPAQGQRIDIFCQWTDAVGTPHRVPAKRWVRFVTRRFYGEELEKLPDGLIIPEDSELRYDSKNKEIVWFGHMTEAQRDHLKGLSNDPTYQKAIDSFFKRSQYRELDANWVFAGSGFEVNEQTGDRFYLAESGDLICVANFPSAMLDLAVKSSASNEDLVFEPYTERVPIIGTEVTLELVPVFNAGDKQPAK